MSKPSVIFSSLVLTSVLCGAVAIMAGCNGSSSGPGVTTVQPIAPVANPCPRGGGGGVVQNPPDLFSKHGVLTVYFSYQTITDSDGRNLFCFMTPGGLENPTLHVNPGDHLVSYLRNNTPKTPVA